MTGSRGPLDWTLATVAAVSGGLVVGDVALPIHVVGTDSRTIEAGAAFVAIVGERFDGHDFAGAALEDGAIAVVVEKGRCSDLEPRVEVASTTEALRDLAVHRRMELDIPVLAVTGSTGKTSTKDLLASVMPSSWASPQSYNNEVGVPLTVLSTPGEADALVVEVGSRGIGQIRWLAPAIRPDVAVITNLGVVHLETFGTRDRLADAKWELVEALGAGGVAVLPVDEPRLRNRSHPGPTVTFGRSPAADVGVDSLTLDEMGRARFELRVGGESREVRLELVGAHHASNSAAAAAAAHAAGWSPDEIVAGLQAARGSPGRMEVHRGRYTVVNDAYNANPDSMEAALRTVAAMAGRHVAVLGEMAELGRVREEEHERIGRLVAELDYRVAVIVGSDHGLARSIGPVAIPVGTPEAAIEVVADLVEPGDVVLVKGSRAVGLETVAIELEQAL